MAPLTVPILVRAAQLPRHHKDPADRFIIATTLLNNLPVATADHRLQNTASKPSPDRFALPFLPSPMPIGVLQSLNRKPNQGMTID